MIFGPEFITRGFIFEDVSRSLLDDAEAMVSAIIGETDKPLPIDTSEIEATIQRRLKRFFYRVIEKRPLIVPVIITI
ncbi:MAG: hypothetical protein U5R49_20390 [Deltaproteobacteria bacterium]|nr:hypothetical protein [Deltaproteobacteria bacterium]